MTETIDRDELAMLVFTTFKSRKAHTPLNMKFWLVPNWQWCLDNTPELRKWVASEYDCDAIAIDFKAANPGWCIGVVTIKWQTGINHTLNLVVLEGQEVFLYDARQRVFYRPKDIELVRVQLL